MRNAPARWFRLYAEFATDPKVQMLSEVDQRRYVMALCIRCGNGDETLHETDIAFHETKFAFQMRVSVEEWRATKARLMAAGLLDEYGRSPAWEKRQYISDSSTYRVAKHREKKRAERNADETLQKRPQRTENRDRDKIESANALLSETSSDAVSEKPKSKKRKAYPEAFEAFWKAYPTDPIMSKKAAFDAWGRLSEEDRDKAGQAVPAFAKHCQANPDYRPVHAVRFLSQRRFDGFAGDSAAPQFMSDTEFQKWWKERHRSPVQ